MTLFNHKSGARAAVYYEVIAAHSWVAIDYLQNYPKTAQLSATKAGSYACRALLRQLQQQLGLTGDLQADTLPYVITHQNRRYFVSFSHSRVHVAVLLSSSARLGIDIEDKKISEKLAQRFFEPAEIQWLATLTASHLCTARLRNLMWSLKECYIKLPQSAHSNLIRGLKTNLLCNIGANRLLELVTQPAHTQNHLLLIDTLIIGYLPTFSAAFIVDIAPSNNVSKN
ncbi:MAG: 4'-phosphopantetheinyl transferase family protein [Moraxella sp.]|jgi:hypothetical protein